MKEFIDSATQAGGPKTPLSAFNAASLIDLLRSPGRYTDCAPTDAAFDRLTAGSLDVMFKNTRTLRPFLFDQMMNGEKAANDLRAGMNHAIDA
jgi:uncharacterized surface protein with fasciclin (FAS1) repeats